MSAIASWQPSAMAFWTIGGARSPTGSPRVPVPQPDRRPAEARVERLARVGFPTEARLEVEVLPDRIDGRPEGRRREFDDRVPHGMLDFPVLHEVRFAAGVLRVVPFV